MVEEKTYRVDLKCTNCKRMTWNVKIPMGTSIEEFGADQKQKCEHCKCYLIKVKENKDE